MPTRPDPLSRYLVVATATVTDGHSWPPGLATLPLPNVRLPKALAVSVRSDDGLGARHRGAPAASLPYRSGTRYPRREPGGEALVDRRDDSMRVSDAERDATLRILGDHAAVGRLSLDELDERCEQALTVRTRGELTALTSDLPKDTASASAQATALAEAHRPVRRTVAILGGSSRRGQFLAVGSFSAIAVMGGDSIDLREAEIEGGELTIRVFSVMGAVNIYVPDSVEVELGGFSLLGANREQGAHRRRHAQAPVIRVRGFNLMGRTTVFRVPLHAHTLGLAEARHLSVAAGHRHRQATALPRRHPHRGAQHHGSHPRQH
jgi:Domain of unknown function (DUF1707)/Cell wall-active antibiotics response 4TMS YvqF